jgi:hypothetical protein
LTALARRLRGGAQPSRRRVPRWRAPGFPPSRRPRASLSLGCPAPALLDSQPRSRRRAPPFRA